MQSTKNEMYVTDPVQEESSRLMTPVQMLAQHESNLAGLLAHITVLGKAFIEHRDEVALAIPQLQEAVEELLRAKNNDDGSYAMMDANLESIRSFSNDAKHIEDKITQNIMNNVTGALNRVAVVEAEVLKMKEELDDSWKAPTFGQDVTGEGNIRLQTIEEEE